MIYDDLSVFVLGRVMVGAEGGIRVNGFEGKKILSFPGSMLAAILAHHY